MYKYISSFQNPAIKRVLQLQEKSRRRRKEGRFVLEGVKEYTLAYGADYVIEELYFCEGVFSLEEIDMFKTIHRNTSLNEVKMDVYEKMAYRGSSQGIMAVCISKDLEIGNFELDSASPLILIAEAPEKPGNIGALLRTADAANLDAVFIANPRTDMYNPNIIRSSIGCVFTNKIATGTSTEIIDFLKKNNIPIYGTAFENSVPYDTIDFTSPSAIVVGTEDEGLTKEWLQKADKNIIIPMQGKIDSMNVSVAAGILIFEAKRQRNFQ